MHGVTWGESRTKLSSIKLVSTNYLRLSFVNVSFNTNKKKGQKISILILIAEQNSHCLGMSCYVNFLGGIGNNGFHIK